MPTTYTLCQPGDDALDALAAAVRRWRPAFVEVGVQIGLLMADNPDGPALKKGGYACAALVKVVPLEQRASCDNWDARVLVDRRGWDALSGREQEALLAHEVSHLDLVYVDGERRDGTELSGVYQADDLGRPRLKTVPGDWAPSDGFHDIVAHYGEDAAEYRSLAQARVQSEAALAGRPKPGGTLPIDFGEAEVEVDFAKTRGARRGD